MLMRASPFMVAGWGYGVSSGCQYFSFFKILVNLLRSDIESLLTRLSACVQTVYRTVCTDTRFRLWSKSNWNIVIKKLPDGSVLINLFQSYLVTSHYADLLASSQISQVLLTTPQRLRNQQSTRLLISGARFRFKSYTLNFQNKKHPHEPYPLK